MIDNIQPDAYELWGITQNKDEDGNHYEKRETVLSYKEDDAGKIDIHVSEVVPLYTADTIIAAIQNWQGEPDPSGDKEINEAAVKLAEKLKERLNQE